ncbi:hypothetical protein PSN45_002764 [Yamadazyma tenuis]|uniref:PSP proline-rich domain-containing protein n=1 Tax=Candida tenuis (strain ATCC 10573 / BCRC 21748 / CBS 615 / JCM 9827 / NBRC 10315 / NRRL Y-1498 / VKM Y-70) TaxID=590646 RepID=G3AWV3_CANTC|nr:uncharacterized protein CANTEDRAFT_117728 [Yamadazyma tenuis ATCC 10573]EGV66626.1 hypothetical protein CANTEDRAFT_117728 [Yamadazyma tenuis ATCC 10573]WEJ95251.1 hypothetical protein PSN45_002764 [Yamadazyma tenuis]
MSKVRLSKNQLRREKLKKRKLNSNDTDEQKPVPKLHAPPISQSADTRNKDEDVKPNPSVESNLYKEFESIFSKFEGSNEKKDNDSTNYSDLVAKTDEDKDLVSDEDSDEFELEDEDVIESKSQLQRQNKVSMAHLKAVARNPQVVEWADVDANDPYLLVSIKSNLNVVPVPSHWSSKRDYLAGKRGVERPPFQLPSYILETGIQDMRNSSDESTLRQQQREKVQPKMGKLDIDYQKLHDAFFKYQTRPKLLGYGDVYYEGRETTDENEDKLTEVKPGKLSVELLKAMGLPENGKTPPPWISTMSQIGKPPTYSHLLIPGIDITYANVGYLVNDHEVYGQDSDDGHWGDVQVEESSEDEDDGDEDESDDESEPDPTVQPTYFEEESSKDTGDEIVIHQKPSNDSSKNKTLYTVIKENEAESTNGLLESERKYQLNDDNPTEETTKTEELQAKPARKFKF